MVRISAILVIALYCVGMVSNFDAAMFGRLPTGFGLLASLAYLFAWILLAMAVVRRFPARGGLFLVGVWALGGLLALSGWFLISSDSPLALASGLVGLLIAGPTYGIVGWFGGSNALLGFSALGSAIALICLALWIRQKRRLHDSSLPSDRGGI